ncbi:hypothetical protein [Actinomadura terrae]|uniref:hypothetical protein n=1 Tax=Actinomadura terrae TaxID=604353 RepID=UPI001FA70B18|nr:hypothetical protein [Actinomadura terrae]
MRPHALKRLVLTAVTVLAPVAALSPPAHADTAGAAASSDKCTMWPWPPVPPGFQKIADGYFTCESCSHDGEYGLARGSWTDYRCVTHQAGMEVFDALYVLR